MEIDTMHLLNVLEKYEGGNLADPADGRYLQSLREQKYFIGYFEYPDMKLRLRLSDNGNQKLEALRSQELAESEIIIEEGIAVLPGGNIEIIA